MSDEEKNPGEPPVTPPVEPPKEEDSNAMYEGEAHMFGDMNAELDVIATVKQEVILGVSSELVVGDELVTVLGGTEYLHAIGLLDFTLGATLEGYVGPKVELGMARTKAHAQETRLEGMSQQIRAHTANIAAVCDVVRGDHTNITGIDQRVRLLRTELDTEKNKITALESHCSVDQMHALANSIVAIAQDTKAIADKVCTGANTVTLSGTTMELSGSVAKTSATATTIAAMQTMI